MATLAGLDPILAEKLAEAEAQAQRMLSATGPGSEGPGGEDVEERAYGRRESRMQLQSSPLSGGSRRQRGSGLDSVDGLGKGAAEEDCEAGVGKAYGAWMQAGGGGSDELAGAAAKVYGSRQPGLGGKV
jgi:hypothetical protein